ncbi:dipeptidase 1 (renal) [Branchiostoma belcheri]|nr:dipeptidase 1 (renal) [Branchiostoma belcheri]
MDDAMHRTDDSVRQSSPPDYPISPSPEPVCGICQGKFWNPRGLRCFHTFCQDCLQQHAHISGRPARITCPTCQDTDMLPPDGIDGLPFNFYLNKISKAKQLAACNASCYKAEMKTGHSDSDTHCKLECQKTSPTDIRDVESLVQSCRAKLKERGLMMKELNQQGIEMKHNMLNIKQQVHDLVQQIISDLQHREVMLMKDLESRYSRNISALSKAKASVDRTGDLLQDACDSAEKLIHLSSPSANMIHSTQMELSKLLVELSRPFSIKKFHFLPITQNIAVKGLGSIVCSPITIFNSPELKTVHDHGSFFIDDRLNTTVKKSQSTVCGGDNSSNSSEVSATRVDNPVVESSSGKGKKKTQEQKSKRADETITLKTSNQTFIKTSDEPIALKTSRQNIAPKTSYKTIALKKSDETIPLNTSHDTHKTSDETISHRKSDETKARDRSNHSGPKAISREFETIPLKASSDHPVRDDIKIPRRVHASKNTSSKDITKRRRDGSLTEATPSETTSLKAAWTGHHLTDGSKIPRPVPAHNCNKKKQVNEKSSKTFIADSPVSHSDISLTLNTTSTTTEEQPKYTGKNKQIDLGLNYPKPAPQYNSPSMPATNLTSANPGKKDDCKANSVSSNHQKAVTQNNQSPSKPAASSVLADKEQKESKKKPLIQKGSEISQPNGELSKATCRTYTNKSIGKAKAKVTFSKLDTAIPTEKSGNLESKKDSKPVSAQQNRRKSLFKCLSKKDKKREEKSKKARFSALAKCNRRHNTEGKTKIQVQESPYETAYPTVRSSNIPLSKAGQTQHPDGKQQTNKTQKHQSLSFSQQHREVFDTYMLGSVRPTSGSKRWPWATRHQRSAKKRPDKTEKQS